VRGLHLGQSVRFVDVRTGQLRQGKVTAKHSTRAVVFEEAVHRSWKIPYVAIDAAETTPGDDAKPYDPPPEPSRPTIHSGFARGDRVSCDDGNGNTLIGMVAKINLRAASVITEDGRSWRVGRPCCGIWSTSDSSRQCGRGPMPTCHLSSFREIPAAS